jgi:hypothetical protein
METTLAERVAAGASWLDQNQSGWEERIDPVRLDLSDAEDCILGQLYGGFYYAPVELDATYRYGFDIDTRSAAHGRSIDRFDQLTEAWRQLLAERGCAA